MTEPGSLGRIHGILLVLLLFLILLFLLFLLIVLFTCFGRPRRRLQAVSLGWH